MTAVHDDLPIRSSYEHVSQCGLFSVDCLLVWCDKKTQLYMGQIAIVFVSKAAYM